MRTLIFLLGSLSLAAGVSLAPKGPPVNDLVVLGYNDLGMHCMNEDFSEICILPPYNTLRAEVISRSEEPMIVRGGAVLNYEIPGNTKSTTKTNFWSYAYRLFGVHLPLNVGLAGKGLTGQMVPQPEGDWAAFGIPLTPRKDNGVTDPYQLATIRATYGTRTGSTQAVVPVAWELRCDWCHKGTGISTATHILRSHDRLHGTHLLQQKPVLCASCHADPALGAPGKPGIPTLSSAMHGAHAPRFINVPNDRKCYSCHPGAKTQCLRDVHKAKGLQCTTCHGGLYAVGNPARKPWVDEPKCGSCHHVAGHEYEQPGVLYRDSIGHNGVKCIACHNSPHAILPSINPRDNVQAIAYQGFAGTIQKCTVCHTQTPGDPFNHTRSDGGRGAKPPPPGSQTGVKTLGEKN